MMDTAARSGVNRDFDRFLQAPIDEGGSGILLSVISALARLDLDPWQEAEELSALSRETATRRLAALIASLPAAPPLERNPASIAARLITLLPRRMLSRAAIAPHKEEPAETRTQSALTKVALIVLLCLFLIAVIASQLLNATPAAIPADSDQAATSTGP